jgi:hypothetical protein
MRFKEPLLRNRSEEALVRLGRTRLSGAMLGSSVKPPNADIWRPVGNVAEVPGADIAPLTKSASQGGGARLPLRESTWYSGPAHSVCKMIPVFLPTIGIVVE